MADEFRFVQDGLSYAGTPKWDVFVSTTGEYVGFTASTTSRIGGTVWMAATPMGLTATRGHRNREAAAIYLREKARQRAEEVVTDGAEA